jgi:ribosome-binding factor A
MLRQGTSARGHLRRARPPEVRVVPQLEFFVDDTNDYVEKMDQLFDQISKEPRQDEE